MGGACAEALDGSNCQTCGDEICDTPADPNLANRTLDILSCSYMDNDGYAPLTNNFMSYTRASCANSFTSGQGQRMRLALSSSSLLQQVQGTSCATPAISGPATVCSQATYAVQNLPQGATVQWSSSNTNIATVSGSGANATITKIGNGEVRIFASVNGNVYTVSRMVWIGTPLIDEITGTRHFPNGGTGTYTAHISSGGDDTYQWSIYPIRPITSFGSQAIIEFPSNNADYTITLTVTNNCGPTVQYYFVSTGDYQPERTLPQDALRRSSKKQFQTN